MTRDDWLRALAEAEVHETYPDALTVREFAELIGTGKDAAYASLKRLVEVGKAQRVMRRKRNIQGHFRTDPAYRLIGGSPVSHDARDDNADVLDGAETRDQAPEPDDEPAPAHRGLRENPRARPRDVPALREREPRPRRQRVAGRS